MEFFQNSTKICQNFMEFFLEFYQNLLEFHGIFSRILLKFYGIFLEFYQNLIKNSLEFFQNLIRAGMTPLCYELSLSNITLLFIENSITGILLEFTRILTGSFTKNLPRNPIRNLTRLPPEIYIRISTRNFSQNLYYLALHQNFYHKIYQNFYHLAFYQNFSIKFTRIFTIQHFTRVFPPNYQNFYYFSILTDLVFSKWSCN